LDILGELTKLKASQAIACEAMSGMKVRNESYGSNIEGIVCLLVESCIYRAEQPASIDQSMKLFKPSIHSVISLIFLPPLQVTFQRPGLVSTRLLGTTLTYAANER